MRRHELDEMRMLGECVFEQRAPYARDMLAMQWVDINDIVFRRLCGRADRNSRTRSAALHAAGSPSAKCAFNDKIAAGTNSPSAAARPRPAA